MVTDQPAAVSTSAAVAPPGPDPTITASTVTGSDTSASVHPRGWTSPANPMASQPAPSRFPPYSGAPYMPSQQWPYSSSANSGSDAQPGVLLRRARARAKSAPRAARPCAVALLEPDHRAVELALGPALGPLDPHPPGQLVEGRQPVEAGEGRLAAVAARRGPSGPDPRRIDGEGARAARRCSRAPRPPRPRARARWPGPSGRRPPTGSGTRRRSTRRASGHPNKVPARRPVRRAPPPHRRRPQAGVKATGRAMGERKAMPLMCRSWSGLRRRAACRAAGRTGC